LWYGGNVNAEGQMTAHNQPMWWRRLSIFLRRTPIVPILEALSVLALIVAAIVTYLIATRQQQPQDPLSPSAVAILLVANLLPAMALMALLARRIAIRRAAASQLGGRGRLHVRLVALFSVVASVPTLLVVIFASLLFQSGSSFWFSGKARGMLDNAATIAQETYDQEARRVARETETMAGDLAQYLSTLEVDDPRFTQGLVQQVYVRNLSEAVILSEAKDGSVHSIALVNPYERQLERAATPSALASLHKGAKTVPVSSTDRIGALTRLPIGRGNYLYAARVFAPELAAQLDRARKVQADDQSLTERARNLQFRFNTFLYLVSLLIVALVIWTALALADRLVRPVGQLVVAARRIAGGDLSVRVPPSRTHDEVGTLGNAFNRMTRRLEEQTGALVSANNQLQDRRAFIEAVLSGVSAGVISVDHDGNVRLINSSAEALLKTGRGQALGKNLTALAPELDHQLKSDEREGIIQFTSGDEPRTLAVKRVKVEGGHVLTFDDITQQITDQRRAAWADVARRIAHEIKNPLTPIQLAAERLQRRYGKEIANDPQTFEQLTGTIVRQVGDLRRMVDEFSSFARVPKPVFREEDIVEIARQALFLHEVAHPDIRFSLEAPEPPPMLVCDRRQLGQALTNIVKNGVEAIQQTRETGADGSRAIHIAIACSDGSLCIDVTDSGIGLPQERDRLTEPYMTTRAKGTGLGLAIVKKIVEEHFGSIEFDDAPGGGTKVRIVLDPETLARVKDSNVEPEDSTVNGYGT
jgi:two-component system nitrogen regulation sensor histidine kinase NtrY